MKIGIPKEPEAEKRVAMVPDVIPKLTKNGFEIVVEDGLGNSAGFSNEEYRVKGANVTTRNEVMDSEIIMSIGVPENEKWNDDQTVVCLADPFRDNEIVKRLAKEGVNLCSMDMIPRRLSKAQSMDVNSSQDNLAGYKSVILGGQQSNKLFPMMMTSAGTVRPAKVVIMGAGVAGLQAIATAKRLGAVVYASDVRLAAKEQIESLGGKFIEVEGMEDFEDESGYAKPLTPEFIQKVNETVCKVAEDADVVITTARIFGRDAPITVPADAVKRMKKGAVIVDMNTDTGGNCELSEMDKVVEKEGVVIVGVSNLPGTVANTASMLYANNVANFVNSLSKDGEFILDMEDEILTGPSEESDFYVKGMGGVLVTTNGEIQKKQERLKEVIK